MPDRVVETQEKEYFMDAATVVCKLADDGSTLEECAINNGKAEPVERKYEDVNGIAFEALAKTDNAFHGGRFDVNTPSTRRVSFWDLELNFDNEQVACVFDKDAHTINCMNKDLARKRLDSMSKRRQR